MAEGHWEMDAGSHALVPAGAAHVGPGVLSSGDSGAPELFGPAVTCGAGKGYRSERACDPAADALVSSPAGEHAGYYLSIAFFCRGEMSHTSPGHACDAGDLPLKSVPEDRKMRDLLF